LPQWRRSALPALFRLHAGGDDPIERLGDLGDALADQIVEDAGRHDRQDRLFRLPRLLFVGEGEQPFCRIEDAPGGVLRCRADGRELAQRMDQHGDLFGHRPAVLSPLGWRASPRTAPCCGQSPAR